MSTGEAPPRLEKRLGSALGWLYLTQYSGKLLVFLSVAILARLLTPDDFALVAISLALIVFIDSLEVGVGSALIYLDRDEAARCADTAFTLHLSMALVAATGFALAAPSIASLYGDDRLEWVIRLLALNLVLRALGQTHENLLRRDLDFRRRLIPEVGSGMSKGVSSVVLALAGAGVWALVAGQLIGSAARALLLWIRVPFRPRLDFGRGGKARRLLAYGLPLLAHAVLGAIAINADYLVIGGVLGVTAVGFYVIAYRIPQLIFQEAFGQIHLALFPYYSRSREQGDDVGGPYFATVRIVSMLVIPFLVPLMVLAGPAVHVVFGPQWDESARILPGLALGAAMVAVGGLSGDLFKARGLHRVLPLVALSFVVVWLPTLILVAPRGTEVVAWSWSAAALGWTLLYWTLARRYLQIGLLDHARAVAPAIGTGLVAAGTAAIALATLPQTAALFAGTAAVVVVWALLAPVVNPEARRALTMLRRRRAAAGAL
ncbi:MAG: lipopolysaccharide biosynthesis protein [Miltoncostaeaceae bacterium]